MYEIAIIVLLVIVLVFLVRSRRSDAPLEKMPDVTEKTVSSRPVEMMLDVTEKATGRSVRIYTDKSYTTSATPFHPSNRQQLSRPMMESVDYILADISPITNCATNCTCAVCSGPNGTIDTVWRTYNVRGRDNIPIGSMTRGQFAELERIFAQLC